MSLPESVAPTHATQLSAERFRTAVAARAQEIELFWKRSLFFWGFISVAFAGFASTRDSSPLLGLVVSSFGLFCSWTWSLLNRGSKYWQENWEAKVNSIEAAEVGDLFKVQEPVQRKGGGWLSARRFSVSRLTIALSDYVTAVWVALSVQQCARLFGYCLSPTAKPFIGLAWLLFTLVFIGLVLWFAKSGQRESDHPV